MEKLENSSNEGKIETGEKAITIRRVGTFKYPKNLDSQARSATVEFGDVIELNGVNVEIGQRKFGEGGRSELICRIGQVNLSEAEKEKILTLLKKSEDAEKTRGNEEKAQEEKNQRNVNMESAKKVSDLLESI